MKTVFLVPEIVLKFCIICQILVDNLDPVTENHVPGLKEMVFLISVQLNGSGLASGFSQEIRVPDLKEIVFPIPVQFNGSGQATCIQF